MKLDIVPRDEAFRINMRSKVVEILEGALAQAKAGEVDEVFVVSVKGDCCDWAWSGTESTLRLVGMLERMKVTVFRDA